ncbi:von Willebrand factor A domain-containing protein 1-like [Oculina patagonica]
MWKLLLTVILSVHFAEKRSSAYIWERTKRIGLDPWARYQRVPPAHETADKLMRYFLGIDSRVMRYMKRRQRRSVESSMPRPYAQFDAIFIIDSSASILPKDFQRTLKALQLLTGKAQQDRRYAAVTFSYNASVRFNFTDRGDTVAKLQEIPFEAGKTNTQEALEMCRKELILKRECGARPGYRKRVLIVTDGQSNVHKHKTLFEAFKIKLTGTQIFVIAIGKYLKGISEIVGLASSTDAHLYRVADVKGLLRVVRMIPPWHIMKEYIRRSWLNGMLRP